ncbi:MAG TPA: GNAT family N-acetyltransferase [Propionibacteriaceae bacterium]|nr:GNAT family N-acetyltransferase [Propionibacteriaceae bacterium]
MSEIMITRNPELERYEAHIAGALAGYAEYLEADHLIVFPHTEVDPGFEGQGVGGTLARFALDHVRSLGTMKVMPLCPFIRSWIERHPEYADLVYGAPASHVSD